MSSGQNMADKRRVLWSVKSSSQIQSIKNYLLEEWSKKEVNSFVAKLRKFENLVVRFLKLYPTSLEYPNLRKAVIAKHQSVIYEIDGDIIRVHIFLNHLQK